MKEEGKSNGGADDYLHVLTYESKLDDEPEEDSDGVGVLRGGYGG